MRRSPPQFHDPINAAYRQRPPDLVAAAEAAGQRLQDPTDYEALHDFRVAVRRLRTHIEAHRSQLGKRRVQKLLGQLGELASATNTFRDREVQREWLRKQTGRKNIAKLQREGLGLILNDLNGSDPKSAQPLDLLGRNFSRVCRDFKQRWTSRSGGDTSGHDPLNTAVAQAIIKHSATLRRQLAKLRSLDDVKATHRARLAVKRLRYLLEPLDQVMPGARKLVRDLKGLQDRLGDLRDLQILETHITVKVGEAAGRWSERLVAAGTEDLRVAAITRGTAEHRACYALAAGMQRVRSEARREFKELHKRWLNGSADRLVDRIERVALRL